MKRRLLSLLLTVSVLTLLGGCGSPKSESVGMDAATDSFSGGIMNGIMNGLVNNIQSVGSATMDGAMNMTYPEVEGIPMQPQEDFNTEEYNVIKENSFEKVALNPLSTFAADVDTGSYCNLRRLINRGESLENVSSAIRTEEIINYFDYKVEGSSEVFTVQYENGACPWNENHDLLYMIFQANATENVPEKGNNFVFLIDTSGSMNNEYKLPMVVESFKLLASTIDSDDRISIVTYSGSSATLLEGSNDYNEICAVLDSLEAGGGTNGSGGIEAAYAQAKANFILDGNNRVIIASDGDMNLGVTSQSGLVDLIKEKKNDGIFLTVLGYGAGNYSDANMESIADAGNGNYYYIDCMNEAQRVLCDKLQQTTVTVAKDVKFQVEFNPAVVSEYRQIGYENRQMSASDFSDDTKDGGEVGAGQQVTVVYEIVYTDGTESTEGLKYQDATLTEESKSNELCTVSVCYKKPQSDTSELLTYPILNVKDDTTSDTFKFIAGIVETSLVVRDSEYKGAATLATAYELATVGANDNYKKEFCDLVKMLMTYDK